MKLHVYYAGLTLCMTVALLCFFERRAYAYIDPGSGILACQAISAFLAGTFYYFRRRVKLLMGRLHFSDHSPR
jgi:hypothetical protein